jgi:hypothetical protein
MMNARNLVAVLGAGFLIAACGGAPDSTGTSVNDLNAHASAHQADAAGGGGGNSGHGGGGMQGGGKSCKPPDGGPSPCAQGQGDDEDGGEADEKDAQGGNGKSCKPVDGGRSPCAQGRGDGGDDNGDDKGDGGDDQGDDQGKRTDGGKKD